MMSVNGHLCAVRALISLRSIGREYWVGYCPSFLLQRAFAFKVCETEETREADGSFYDVQGRSYWVLRITRFTVSVSRVI